MQLGEWGSSISWGFVPNPAIPGDYFLYLVIRDPAQALQIPEKEKQQIRKYLKSPKLSQVHILSPVIEAVEVSEEVSQEKKSELFHSSGLIWLSKSIKNGRKVIFKILLEKEKVVLPYVPEFAHDYSRSQKMLTDQYDMILPITAEFVPTANCPFRCRQCSYKAHKTAAGLWESHNFSEKWHMPLSMVEPLIKKLKDGGVRYLVVTGGGEPLMNPEVTVEALRCARKCGIQTGLYTNGSLLTEKLAKQILTESPRFVRISVNAGSADIHTRYHRPIGGKSVFDKVIGGIKEIIAEKKRVSSLTEIGLSYIINKDNVSDLKKFAELVVQMDDGIDFVRFTPTINYYSETELDVEFCEKAHRQLIQDAIPILHKKGIATITFSRFWEARLPRSYKECLGCAWYATIAPDGGMHMCCETNLMPGYWIGNLKEQDLETIWRGETRKSVVARINRSCMRACPMFCKPHNANKITDAIRKKCETIGGHKVAKQWLKDLSTLHEFAGNRSFEKMKTVAF